MTSSGDWLAYTQPTCIPRPGIESPVPNDFFLFGADLAGLVIRCDSRFEGISSVDQGESAMAIIQVPIKVLGANIIVIHHVAGIDIDG